MTTAVAAAIRTQHVLRVDFCSADGRRWRATGGGPTVADAIAFARESCPGDATWRLDGWSPLYGD